MSRLFLVGVGPGDPELLTCKAERILKEADVIAAPVTAPGESSQALGIISDLLEEHRQQLLPLLFPMTSDQAVLRTHWDEACRLIAHQIGLGKKVAFIALGDPLFYATSLYVLEGIKRDYPEIPLEIVPGVPSIFAAAAVGQFPIVEGGEKVFVVPATAGMDEVMSALDKAETVVVMKVKPVFKGLLQKLQSQSGIRMLFAERVGMAGQVVLTDPEEIAAHSPDYLSLLVIRRCSC